jgi:hypothetical protein
MEKKIIKESVNSGRKALPKTKVLANISWSAKGGEAGSAPNSVYNCISLVKVQSCNC